MLAGKIQGLELARKILQAEYEKIERLETVDEEE